MGGTANKIVQIPLDSIPTGCDFNFPHLAGYTTKSRVRFGAEAKMARILTELRKHKHITATEPHLYSWSDIIVYTFRHLNTFRELFHVQQLREAYRRSSTEYLRQSEKTAVPSQKRSLHKEELQSNFRLNNRVAKCLHSHVWRERQYENPMRIHWDDTGICGRSLPRSTGNLPFWHKASHA